MSFLNKIFGSNKEKGGVQTYSNTDFWNWFLDNEATFFRVVKEHRNIESAFFDKVSPKLNQIREGYYLLTGMSDEHTAELIISVEGAIKNFGFAEALITDAPELSNWKFTALKPSFPSTSHGIEMEGFRFDDENITFYAKEDAEYPDNIDLVFAHKAMTEEHEDVIINGTYIFLDNYLGELNFATLVDAVSFVRPADINQEEISITKLKDYLIWRQKEFVEKYEGTRYTDEDDSYSSLEGQLKNGLPLVAIINTTLLEWEAKASHPWILNMVLEYDGSKNNGMPTADTYELMNTIEDELMGQLNIADGFLNIGRETADGRREVFIACKNFRKASSIADGIQKKYEEQIQISYDVYKDKYWKSFERFRPELG